MPVPDPLVIRSYRTVFRFERRLYRIDRWRLPLPGGLPVRALLYAPLAYGLVALAGALPLLGGAFGALPAPLRFLLLPLGLVAAAVRLQLDGRPAHRALWALMRWSLERRWLAGLRPCPPPTGRVPLHGTLTVRPDHRRPVYHAGNVRGPARVLLRAPAALTPDRGDPARLQLTAQPGEPLRRGRVVDVPADAALVLR